MTAARSDRPAQATVVAVVGAADASEDEVALAWSVGRGLAAAGHVVLTGGGTGVMAAASVGAHDAGGTTIGILPGLDRAAANPDVDIAIPTGLGEGRNVLVVRAADVVVAVGGEYGTLSEIALALKAGTPVVGIGTWELRRRGELDPGIVVADDADAAVTIVEGLLAGRD